MTSFTLYLSIYIYLFPRVPTQTHIPLFCSGDDDDKPREFYSGGTDNRGGGSGLNVIDPNDKFAQV